MEQIFIGVARMAALIPFVVYGAVLLVAVVSGFLMYTTRR